MLKLLSVPENCICNISIPLEKVVSGSLTEDIQSILWYASLKPELIKVSAVKDDSKRYEEIQIIKVALNSADTIYDIAHRIYKSIKYPCVLIFNYNNKYMCGACQFTAGKIDYSKNILGSIRFSHWLYPESLSLGAQKMIDAINLSLNLKSDLFDIYIGITNSIENFALSGITKAHVDRLLKDMLGSVSAKKRDEIMKYCTPYQKHFVTDSSIAAKYDKSRRTSNYVYSYDHEDIWYCLMQYEPTRKVIINRRYRDIEDLIYTIDTKLEEYTNWW